ncbi:hypothetical protein ABPG74_007033 [Tetrahymena malaccensis]
MENQEQDISEVLKQIFSKIDQINYRINIGFGEQDQKIAQINYNMNEQNQRIAQINNSMNEQNQRIVQINNSMNEQNQRIVLINNSMNEQNQIIAQINNSMNANFGDVVQKIGQMDQKIGQMDQKIGQMDQKIGEMNQTTNLQIAHMAESMNTLQDGMQTLVNQCDQRFQQSFLAEQNLQQNMNLVYSSQNQILSQFNQQANPQ